MSKNLNFAYQLIDYEKYIEKRKPNRNHPDMTREYVERKTNEFLSMGGVITDLDPSIATTLPLDHNDLLKS